MNPLRLWSAACARRGYDTRLERGLFLAQLLSLGLVLGAALEAALLIRSAL